METRLQIKNNETSQDIAGIYTSDGESKNKLIIMSSAFGFSKNAFPIYKKFANQVSLHGYDVFRYDYSGIGKSSGNFTDVSVSDHISDLSSVMKHYRRKDICLLGHSIGGLISTIAAEGRAEGFIEWNSPLSLEALYERYQADMLQKGYHILDRENKELILGKRMWKELFYIRQNAKELEEHPALFVQGSDDEFANIPRLRKYVVEHGCAKGPHELHTIFKGDHNFLEPDSQEDCIKTTIDWLKKNF